MNLRYFKPEEFLACVPSCSIQSMDADFLQKLDAARHLAGIPFVLTSCFRSSAWDISHGRSGRGYHTRGMAADIRCSNSRDRFAIVKACTEVGLSCGLSKDGFVHIDGRTTSIVFLY